MKKLSKKQRDKYLTLFMVLALYGIIQALLMTGNVSSLMQGLLVPICTYSIVAVGLNLCVGYLGELSIGHAGFMCVGAFTGALTTKLLQDAIPNETLLLILALVVGTLSSALFGFLIGIPVLRLNGDYLAIVTLAFGEIIKNVINVLYVGRDAAGLHFAFGDNKGIKLAEGGKWLINGAKGIAKIPRLSSFTMGIILLVLILLLVYHLVDSRDGRAVMAIRDNEIAAETIGIPVTRYKLFAFTISAAIAGCGGVLYAHNLSTVTATPANFGYNMSIMILVFVVLGGIGSFRGSIIAAALLTLLPEVLRGLSDYRMLIYSIILIVMMLFNWAPSMITWRARLKGRLKKGGVRDEQ